MKHVENDHNDKECKEFNYLILIFDMVGDLTTWKGKEVIMLLCLSIILLELSRLELICPSPSMVNWTAHVLCSIK